MFEVVGTNGLRGLIRGDEAASPWVPWWFEQSGKSCREPRPGAAVWRCLARGRVTLPAGRANEQGERVVMTESTINPEPSEPQRLRALEQANAIRLARAELKRRIGDGEVSAAEVILSCPDEARRWTVGDLLVSQRRWGSTRCRKFLERNGISEIKPIGALTERQRRLLAAQLVAGPPVRERPDVDAALTRAATATPELEFAFA